MRRLRHMDFHTGHAENERRMAAALKTNLSDLDLGTFLVEAQRK
jgi:hypothetical protein